MTLKAFVPRYDAPTEGNARIALFVFPREVNAIIGAAATRVSLQSLIAAPDTTAILMMSHGAENLVCAQDGQTALDLVDIAGNMGGVLRLRVFAWVCKTSLQLGPLFHRYMEQSGAWWGYRTTISAPSAREFHGFKQALDFIAARFPFVSSELEAIEFFRELKNLCEPHRHRIIAKMARTKDYRDAQETASAFREIWANLDAWLYGHPQPCHAELRVLAEESELPLDGV